MRLERTRVIHSLSLSRLRGHGVYGEMFRLGYKESLYPPELQGLLGVLDLQGVLWDPRIKIGC